MQDYKKEYHDFYMSMDVKPKGRKLRRMLWKQIRAQFKAEDSREYRAAKEEHGNRQVYEKWRHDRIMKWVRDGGSTKVRSQQDDQE